MTPSRFQPCVTGIVGSSDAVSTSGISAEMVSNAVDWTQ